MGYPYDIPRDLRGPVLSFKSRVPVPDQPAVRSRRSGSPVL